MAVAGAVGVAVPFVGSWNPSAKAKAAGAPVKFDVSKMEPGQLVRVEWRGQPVFVIRRTKEQIDDLSSIDNLLKDQIPWFQVNLIMWIQEIVLLRKNFWF